LVRHLQIASKQAQTFLFLFKVHFQLFKKYNIFIALNFSHIAQVITCHLKHFPFPDLKVPEAMYCII
jgi:hypothetical protein